MRIIILIALMNNILLSSFTFVEPDYYSKEGYCIVKTEKQKKLGLERFDTINAFRKKCNSKMIFLFKDDSCKKFTSKKMKFNILIQDNDTINKFNIGNFITVCGKRIIEFVK